MKRHLTTCRVFCGAGLALILIAFFPAAAQQAKNSAPGSTKAKTEAVPKGGPAPRTVDGHPDFSGVWFPGTAGGSLSAQPYEDNLILRSRPRSDRLSSPGRQPKSKP